MNCQTCGAGKRFLSVIESETAQLVGCSECQTIQESTDE